MCSNGRKQAYIEHYDAVRKCIAKERLLGFDIKGGWESLCGFLDMDMPRDGFLYGNDEEGCREKRWLAAKMGARESIESP
jgi:hypothetical protein